MVVSHPQSAFCAILNTEQVIFVAMRRLVGFGRQTETL
jgi:hypothetical protein